MNYESRKGGRRRPVNREGRGVLVLAFGQQNRIREKGFGGRQSWS
jgi:hypothetical protein